MEFKLAGNAEFRAKNWESARDLYTKALETDGSLSEVYANRAACALNLQDYQAAVQDCRRGKQFSGIPTPLLVKFWWREAVAHRMLGSSRADWEHAVEEGLKLDPANETLRAEAQYVFVESGIPLEFELSPGKPVVPKSVVPSPTAKPQVDFLPALPLNYSGVLQLVRNKSAQAYDFWYARVSPSDLQRALATAGVEPDVLDYIFGMIVARPTESTTNAGYLHALAASPRYDTALFMADEDLKAQVANVTGNLN